MSIFSDNLFTLYLIRILKRSVWLQFNFNLFLKLVWKGNLRHTGTAAEAAAWQSGSNHQVGVSCSPNLSH